MKIQTEEDFSFLSSYLADIYFIGSIYCRHKFRNLLLILYLLEAIEVHPEVFIHVIYWMETFVKNKNEKPFTFFTMQTSRISFSFQEFESRMDR